MVEAATLPSAAWELAAVVGAPRTTGFHAMLHRLVIFKRPLEEEFPDPRELRDEIRKTVIHELAHHFGYTDRDLERWTTVY